MTQPYLSPSLYTPYGANIISSKLIFSISTKEKEDDAGLAFMKIPRLIILQEFYMHAGVSVFFFFFFFSLRRRRRRRRRVRGHA